MASGEHFQTPPLTPPTENNIGFIHIQNHSVELDPTTPVVGIVLFLPETPGRNHVTNCSTMNYHYRILSTMAS